MRGCGQVVHGPRRRSSQAARRYAPLDPGRVVAEPEPEPRRRSSGWAIRFDSLMHMATPRRRLRRLRKEPSLVLAYHGLGVHPRTMDPHNLMVPPARFRGQMQALLRRGYRFVSLSEFGRELSVSVSGGGVCALTFDDGTVDNLEVGAPLLTELGIPATVFVCPGLLGEPHFAMPARAGVRLLDAEELRALAASPLVEIGSHTNTHVDLSAASLEEAHGEMTR